MADETTHTSRVHPHAQWLRHPCSPHLPPLSCSLVLLVPWNHSLESQVSTTPPVLDSQPESPLPVAAKAYVNTTTDFGEPNHQPTLATAARSAPTYPGVERASAAKSTPSASFMFLVTTCIIAIIIIVSSIITIITIAA